MEVFCSHHSPALECAQVPAGLHLRCKGKSEAKLRRSQNPATKAEYHHHMQAYGTEVACPEACLQKHVVWDWGNALWPSAYYIGNTEQTARGNQCSSTAGNLAAWLSLATIELCSRGDLAGYQFFSIQVISRTSLDSLLHHGALADWGRWKTSS